MWVAGAQGGGTGAYVDVDVCGAGIRRVGLWGYGVSPLATWGRKGGRQPCAHEEPE